MIEWVLLWWGDECVWVGWGMRVWGDAWSYLGRRLAQSVSLVEQVVAYSLLEAKFQMVN